MNQPPILWGSPTRHVAFGTLFVFSRERTLCFWGICASQACAAFRRTDRPHHRSLKVARPASSKPRQNTDVHPGTVNLMSHNTITAPVCQHARLRIRRCGVRHTRHGEVGQRLLPRGEAAGAGGQAAGFAADRQRRPGLVQTPGKRTTKPRSAPSRAPLSGLTDDGATGTVQGPALRRLRTA
jgi:hypothetical protein